MFASLKAHRQRSGLNVRDFFKFLDSKSKGFDLKLLRVFHFEFSNVWQNLLGIFAGLQIQQPTLKPSCTDLDFLIGVFRIQVYKSEQSSSTSSKAVLTQPYFFFVDPQVE